MALVLHNDLTRTVGDQVTDFYASLTSIWAPPQSLLLRVAYVQKHRVPTSVTSPCLSYV